MPDGKCPYCQSRGHHNIEGVVRHVLMCHVEKQNKLGRVLFRDPPRGSEAVAAKCKCGEIVHGESQGFNETLAEHLGECGAFPELVEMINAGT